MIFIYLCGGKDMFIYYYHEKEILTKLEVKFEYIMSSFNFKKLFFIKLIVLNNFYCINN